MIWWILLITVEVALLALFFAALILARCDARAKQRETKRDAAIREDVPAWALAVLETYLRQEEPSRDSITGTQFVAMMDVAWEDERPDDDRLPAYIARPSGMRCWPSGMRSSKMWIADERTLERARRRL